MIRIQWEGALSNGDLPQDRLTYFKWALPVALGVLALLVITFLGGAWNVIHDRGTEPQAIILIFACGAHFVLSWLLVVPSAVLLERSNNYWPLRVGIWAGIGFYMFWSLVAQHRALARLFVDKWRSSPIPGTDRLLDSWTWLFGNNWDLALVWSPLLFSWIVLGLVTAGVKAGLVIRGKANHEVG